MHSPNKESSTSAPDLTNITDSLMGTTASMSNIILRHEKRKRGDVIEDDLQVFMEEIKKMMALNREYQDRQFETLYSAMTDIKQQNSEISKSLDFVSAKYEEMKTRLVTSEEENKKNIERIRLLETRITNFERNSRNASIEIRNLPQTGPESKEDLFTVVKSISKAVQCDLEKEDIKDLFRYASKSSPSMPIIVEFTSVIKKEAILQAMKEFRRAKKTNINTGNIGLTGPTQTLYISESLPAITKRLYARARQFALEYKYQYCWTRNGQIFLRKESGLQVIKINQDEDLIKLAASAST